MIEIYKDKKQYCIVNNSTKMMSSVAGYGIQSLIDGLVSGRYAWFNFFEHEAHGDNVLSWNKIASYNNFNECKNRFKKDYPEYQL